jgi:hypothetical protein
MSTRRKVYWWFWFVTSGRFLATFLSVQRNIQGNIEGTIDGSRRG